MIWNVFFVEHDVRQRGRELLAAVQRLSVPVSRTVVTRGRRGCDARDPDPQCRAAPRLAFDSE